MFSLGGVTSRIDVIMQNSITNKFKANKS